MMDKEGIVSNIAINKAIVHILNKEQREDIQPSTMRNSVLDAEDPIVHKLVEGILAVYGKRQNSADYGVFSTGEGRKQFCNDFDAYAKLAAPGNDHFMGLSESAMRELYKAAELTPMASGGYIIFVDYNIPQGRYFIVAMLKQKPGITMSKDLNPQELMELDLNRLRQAARINFTKLSEYLAADEMMRQEMNFLNFISPSSTKPSAGYFISAIGCVRGAASARATDIVLKQSKALFQSRDELKPHTQRLREKMVSFMAGRIGEGSIKLSEIGQLIKQFIPPAMADEADDLVDGFLEKLNSEEFGVPNEFSANKVVVGRYTTITGEGDYWKVSIDRQALGDQDDAEVYYQRDTGKIIFNSVPDEMRQKIIEELDAKSQAKVKVEE
jgi:nucleoid-associated protein